MALDKATLKAEIKTAAQNAVGTDDSFDTFAQELSDAIDKFVKTGDVVNVEPGAATIGIT